MHRPYGLVAALLVALAPPPTAANGPGDPAALTAVEAAERIRAGTLSARDLTEALLANAEARRGLNAFITLDAEGARAAAAAADADITARRAVGPLHGVPVVVKDNVLAAGLPATAGTPALADFIPRRDAPVVEALRAAGAIILGKTNMHELAFGITSNNVRFGAVGNAYDATRFAGGSSGGTGAAIGARLAPAGLGTDTGGSVRIPAALNGIVGFRPTVGRYGQAGIVPISTTRDTAGPMARSVADVALLDAILAGVAPQPLAPADLRGLRLGVPEPFVDGLEAETERLFRAALARLEESGVVLVPLDLTHVVALNDKLAFPIALYEVRRDLAAFLEAEGTGVTIEQVAAAIASPDVKGVFEEAVLGPKAIPEAVYRAAIDEHRPALRAAYAAAFADNDVAALAFPSTPLPAAPIEGSDETVELRGQAVPTFLTYIRNTDPSSNAALPGLVLPMGLTKEGLPVGLELNGPEGTDRELIALGLAIEPLLGWLPAP